MSKQNTKKNKKASNGSFRSIFMHADWADMFLMTLGLLGAIGDGISMPTMLLITSTIMNNIGDSSSFSMDVFTDKINESAVNLCYMAIGIWVACFLEGYCWARTAERQASRLRSTYLKAVLRQEVAYFDLNVTSTAEIITSVSSDSLVIQEVISEKVPMFLMNTSMFGGAYIVAFILLWRLAIVGLPFIIILVIPGLIYGRVLMNLSRKIREEYNKAGTVAEQAISSVRTVYSFVGENKTLLEYSAALEGTVKLGLKQGMAKGVAIGSNGVVFAVWSFLCWYGSRLVMYHGASGGTVFAVGAAIAVGGLSLGSGLSNLKYFSDAMAASERIREVIIRVPEIDSDNMEGDVLEEVSGRVEFKNVKFAYPSRPESLIFKDFNLKVPAGRTVALVGGSGSGKSTVIALLQRFYDPQGGEICVDGVRIDKLQLKWLRSQMGLVSQEPALFATTIKENILFGKEDATMEEVIEAAKASNAYNFISQLPQAYDTQVGERGVQMSGGQKQRIAIARAIIKSPRILLLDEATSALDTESERVVQEALDQAAVGRTTIVIAHRLSTIRNADIIVVVQDGQVVESGSHDYLIQHDNGLYTSLVRLQETKGKDEPHNPNYLLGPSSVTSTYDVQNTSSRRQPIVSRSSSSSSVNHGGGENITLNVNQDFPVPSFKRLLALNLPEWKQALLGSVGAILFGAVQPLYAFAMGSVISVYFLPDHDEIKRRTMIYALCFVGLAVFSMVINIIQHYNFAAMGECLTKRVRERMLSKILTFEIGWFDQDENSSGAICSRLAKDANVVRSLVGDRMALLIQTISAVTIACTMGLVIAWRLALVMIAVQPLIIVCFYCKRVLLKNMSQKAMKSQEESSKLAAEAVSNLRTVTAFSSQARILKMLQETQKAPMRESIKQAWYAGFGLGFSQSLMACTWALDFWYGGKLISDGHLGSKALFQTFMILVSTGRVIADAGTMTNDLAKGSDAVQSVFAVLDRYTLIEPEDPDGKKPDIITGHIEIRDVDFAYPARPDIMIFKGFSINIEAGKSTALVGQSGSGKSTIIGLIERFYDPIKGVGERGVQMSGGQKQRIAIARAIIKSPRILLLDEATSALDTESERVVQEALDQAAVGRTTIVIAHRLSTIRNADIIVVVQDGQVVESGSHDYLIQHDNGLYTSLVRLQETKGKDEPHNPNYLLGPSSVTSTYDVQNTSSRRQPIVSRSSSSSSVNHGGGENITLNVNQDFPVPSFKRLLALNLPEWKQALLGSVGAILFGAVQPLYAFAMGSVISVYFLPDHDEIKRRTMIYALCFVGLAVFSMVINIIQHYNFAAMGECLTKRVRERMLSKILTFEIGWFDQDENSSGAICSRLAKDANVVRSLVGDRMALLIQTISAVTIACTMGLVIAWRLALVMIAVQPLIIVCFYCKRVLLKNMSQKAMKSQEESSKLAAEAVSNLRTVTAFSSQARILKMLQETQKAPMRESIKQAWYAGFGLGFSQSLMACTWALDFWYGGKLISDGHLGSKALFQTFMILVSTGRVIADAGTMTNDLAKGSDAVQSVFAVLDRYTLIEPEDPDGKKPDIITGHIEIRDVDFAYPARPDIMIFKGFSINIEAGKSTALVGQSGSGKSTIIGLIERFYDPIKGVIKIDGRDIKSYHLRTLRKYIALVSQEPALFAGTIRENILYGASEEVGESEMIEAAKAANAHDFIAVLKDGYDTQCGDRGVQLSGGQKQRIAIARAILKNPVILLLDEATSALDSQSEKVVQEALERMMIGRTSVVVAHRLSTIQSCDTIAVLEKGKVVEKGNHGSLLAKGPAGAYYSLVSLQKTPASNHTID
uniref:Putative ATP-binding cassette subfamily C member 8 n=2 Tax=Helianthus annuus TaxID=4232 RepID=A0A251SJ61_HELAN